MPSPELKFQNLGELRVRAEKILPKQVCAPERATYILGELTWIRVLHMRPSKDRHVISPNGCLQAFGYYVSGSETESTLRDNEESFTRYRLVPRLMVDVSKVDTTVKLMGEGPTPT